MSFIFAKRFRPNPYLSCKQLNNNVVAQSVPLSAPASRLICCRFSCCLSSALVTQFNHFTSLLPQYQLVPFQADKKLTFIRSHHHRGTLSFPKYICISDDRCVVHVWKYTMYEFNQISRKVAYIRRFLFFFSIFRVAPSLLNFVYLVFYSLPAFFIDRRRWQGLVFLHRVDFLFYNLAYQRHAWYFFWRRLNRLFNGPHNHPVRILTKLRQHRRDKQLGIVCIQLPSISGITSPQYH